MSIPYCVHAEISQESDLRGIACGNRKDHKRIMSPKKRRDHRSARNARSHTHIGEHTAERESIIVYGIPERKEHNDNFRTVCSPEIQVWEQTFLESGILCEHGRRQQASRAKIHTKPRDGRHDNWPDQHGGVLRSVQTMAGKQQEKI